MRFLKMSSDELTGSSAVVQAQEAPSSDQVLEPYSLALASPVPEIRRGAVEALGHMRLAAALPLLAQAMLDSHAPVRDAAQAALALVPLESAETASVDRAQPFLEQAVHQATPEIRLRAAETLRRLGRKPAGDLDGEAERLMTVIMVLSGVLESPNRDLRQAAVESLGRLEDGRALAPLLKALRDPDEWVRRAAVYALHALGWHPASLANVACQAVILERWEVAANCGEDAVPPLLLALESAEVSVQLAAIRCLGQIASPQAIEPLVSRLQHGSPDVRRASADALTQIGWQTADPTLLVRHAIARQDWGEAARHGASSVGLLVEAAKEHPPQSEACVAALEALGKVDDTTAVGALVQQARDGQVGAAVVQALQGILESRAAEVPAGELRAAAELANVLQFEYAFDERYGAQVRAGMREVDVSLVRRLAQRELELRQAGGKSPL